MSGYLARLTLRALGRPADTAALPRVATVPAFLRDGGTDEAASVERDIAPLPERSDGEPAAGSVTPRAPAAAIVPRAAIRTADPGENLREHSAAGLGPQAHRASTSPAVTSPPVDREVHPPAVISRGASTRAESRVRTPRKPAETTTRVPSTPLNAVVARETQAQPIAHHVQPARRPAETEPHSDVTASQPGARDAAACPRTDIAHEKPFATDTLRSEAALKPPPALLHASTDGEPASVTVEIGRIEVKLAPAPPTASRARAASDGFDRYSRMRNYLERYR